MQYCLKFHTRNALFAGRPEQTHKLLIRSRVQHILDQVPHVQIIRLANVADRVKRAGILNPDVGHAVLLDERCRGGSNQLIVFGCDDGNLVAGLHNGGSIIQALDSRSIGTNIIASRATESIENFADSLTRRVTEQVGEVIEAREGSGVGRRGDGSNLVDQMGDTLELWDVKRLEGAFGVADQIDLGFAGLLGDFLNIGSDFRGTLVDRFQATQEWETIVCAVGLGVCAVTFALQPVLHKVQVLIIGCTQAVEKDDRVGGALAGEIVDS